MTEIFPKRKTIPAAQVGLSLTISDEALEEIKRIEEKQAKDLLELIHNPIIFD